MPETSTRRHKRHNLIVYLRVYDRDTNALLGYLVDITQQGLMLMSEQPLEANRLYRLRVDKGEVYGPRRYLDLDAQSRWIDRDVNPKLHNTGFSLVDPSPQALGTIEGLILDLSFSD